MKNLLRFDTILAKDIMTPRTVVVSASDDTTVADFHKQHPQLRFSRIPIYNGAPDDVTGYFLNSSGYQQRCATL